jgi:CDP-4-dehydro-6-deoxyglucose reductase
MFSIQLKGGKTIQSNQGETIFNAAQRNGITLEHSCLTAQCESCRCKLLSGNTKPLNVTAKQKEIALSGDILTCNAIPESDVVLDVEDLSEYNIPTVQTLPAKIASIQMVSEDIMLLTLRLPPRRQLKFLPGQYVDINAKGVKRSYSIAGFDAVYNILEFYIRNYAGGAMSDYLFNRAEPNDLLQINGPKGTFFLRHSTKQKIFLATGTGIAPFLSMLNDGDSIENITLYWGMRYENEFFAIDLRSKENIQVHKLVSRKSKDWKGLIGYVQDAAFEQIKNLDQCEVYACGNPAMIESAKRKILEIGLPENQFYSDAFVPSN